MSNAQKRHICLVAAITVLLASLTGCSAPNDDSIAAGNSSSETLTIASEETMPTPISTVEAVGQAGETVRITRDAFEGLTPTQRNSISMLNYLTVLTQEVNSSSNSKLYLEQANSTIYNNTYPNAVDNRTLGQLNTILDTIEKYRMTAVKRDRLEYIYEQNQAQAVRDALPNPLGADWCCSIQRSDPARFPNRLYGC